MRIEDVWDGESVAGRAASAALAPLSMLFGAGVRTRGFLYDRGLIAVHRAPAPVVSVGGLRVGGSGKTPFVLWLAARLRRSGVRPCIVTRGYGATAAADSPLLLRAAELAGANDAALAAVMERAGDEAMLLALRSGCPVVVGADRPASCEHAARVLGGEGQAPGVFLLDDGFQHRALARELDVVLVGSDEHRRRLLPAGPLREPVSALARAGVVVVLRQPGPPAAGDEAATSLPASGALRVHAAARATMLVSAVTERTGEPPSSLAGRRVVAVAAIARPGRFLADLERTGASIVATVLRRDHHRYGEADLRAIDAAAASADLVVTTEKDLVKLAALARKRPTRALRIEVQVDRVAEEDALIERIAALVPFDR